MPSPSTPDQPGHEDLSDVLGDIEIPDDLSSLTDARQDPELAVLITQVAEAEPLAAACVLAGLDVDVVPTPVGALGVLRDTSGDLPNRAAAAVSQLVAGVPLVLVTRHGEQLTCVRYTDGADDGELPPGLVLGGAPDALEDLLTGHLTLADLPGVVSSSGISRLKAVRMLSQVARKGRKKKR
ncbi:hypothetical protein MWU57_06030 [Isoptericola sp. S6320L]|uniref:hypothetical protein n=1 Tax=Isoptericola sp. S6320L TaxID=2926411 RepID=UPI001FF2B5D5|nr:hypothetical protein [Isoptericola sp. S6320L]MCK0116584.1 hypothetical protein [Isoptericola sp. S6320L]